MDFYTRSGLLVFTLLCTALAGAYRAHRMEVAGKILVVYVIASLLTEAVAGYSAIVYRNNMLVYDIGGIIEFVLIMLYYNYTVSSLRYKYIGLITTGLVALFGIANNFLIQPPGAIVNYFLSIEALMIITVSLISLMDTIFNQPYNRILSTPRFWISLTYLIYWCITYFLWTLLAFHRLEKSIIPAGLLLAVFIMNIIQSLSLLVIFLCYPKMNNHAIKS